MLPSEASPVAGEGCRRDEGKGAFPCATVVSIAGEEEESAEDGADSAVVLLAGAGASTEAGGGGGSDDGAEGCAGLGWCVDEGAGTLDGVVPPSEAGVAAEPRAGAAVVAEGSGAAEGGGTFTSTALPVRGLVGIESMPTAKSENRSDIWKESRRNRTANAMRKRTILSVKKYIRVHYSKNFQCSRCNRHFPIVATSPPHFDPCIKRTVTNAAFIKWPQRVSETLKNSPMQSLPLAQSVNSPL